MVVNMAWASYRDGELNSTGSMSTVFLAGTGIILRDAAPSTALALAKLLRPVQLAGFSMFCTSAATATVLYILKVRKQSCSGGEWPKGYALASDVISSCPVRRHPRRNRERKSYLRKDSDQI